MAIDHPMTEGRIANMDGAFAGDKDTFPRHTELDPEAHHVIRYGLSWESSSTQTGKKPQPW